MHYNQTPKIPPPRQGNIQKYNFAQLREYGDYVEVPLKSKSEAHAVRDAGYKYGSYNGFKVATRLMCDDVLVIYHAGKV